MAPVRRGYGSRRGRGRRMAVKPVIPSTRMAKSTPSRPTEMITWSTRTILRTLGDMSGIARRDPRISRDGRTIEIMTSFPPKIL